ncbi:uncharacterized protein LOC118198140 isoform X2 [Stegodyphus dumicola]|uniref:uncharacterized protein LOC118198140 isoform X2 n=1 Tax=Stegodyphus dumicola TaxID=202533 RepID=UPI0015A79EFB|nr:uncharacterized protein LOC118198140 isoform X2 [Stegodyphus dumicola]
MIYYLFTDVNKYFDCQNCLFRSDIHNEFNIFAYITCYSSLFTMSIIFKNCVVLQNILCEVIQQRDIAFSKFQNSSSFDPFSFRSNFQKFHSAEKYSNVECESYQKQRNLNFIRKSIEQTCTVDSKSSKVSSDSASDIRLLKKEIVVLSKALEMEVEKRERMEEKCKSSCVCALLTM